MAYKTFASRGFFFIEIGAHDGITDDFLHEYIIKKKWKGLLIEPVKYIFDKLVLNYKDYDGLIFENVAISNNVEIKNFYRLKENENNLFNWRYDQLGSFSRDILLKHVKYVPNAEDYLLVEQIQCTTLDNLILRHNINDVSLIKIDAEGFDFEIIKTINFSKINPKIIIYEHKHLSTNDCDDCHRLLKKKWVYINNSRR
jgi:FkbM family methyltransferase